MLATNLLGGIGTVVSQDGANHRVNVIMEGVAGGSMATLSVDVGTDGPRDGLRIEQPPLPTKGTRGLILFPGKNLMICLVRLLVRVLERSPRSPYSARSK